MSLLLGAIFPSPTRILTLSSCYRSALVLKDQRLADAAFVHVLEMNPSHHEGRVYLQSNAQMASLDDLAMMMEKYLHTTTFSLRHQSSLTMNGNVVQYFTQPLATGERFLEESVRLSSSVIWELQVRLDVAKSGSLCAESILPTERPSSME